MARKLPRKPPEALPKLAAAEAKRRGPPTEPLGRREALAEAPWDPKTMPIGWEQEFRTLYADELDRLGYTKPKVPSSGKSGTSGMGPTMRSFRVPQDEWDAFQRAAEHEGLGVGVWLRRVGARASERFFKAKKG